MSEKFDAIPLDIVIMNPKRKSTHKCPCLIPIDCLDMDEETFGKDYGPHIVKAVFDLLQHNSFSVGLDQPVYRRLIVDP